MILVGTILNFMGLYIVICDCIICSLDEDIKDLYGENYDTLILN